MLNDNIRKATIIAILKKLNSIKKKWNLRKLQKQFVLKNKIMLNDNIKKENKIKKSQLMLTFQTSDSSHQIYKWKKS